LAYRTFGWADRNFLLRSGLEFALARNRWIASITSGCWDRTASPSFSVQSSFSLIILRTSGVATNDLMLSSQSCLATARLQLIALEILVRFQPTLGLDNVGRIGRSHEYFGEERIGTKGDWRDKLVELLRL
jgi:hypothetical protein